MLRIARIKKIYKTLYELNLNEVNFEPTKTYDALICVGSFGDGALKKKHFYIV